MIQNLKKKERVEISCDNNVLSSFNFDGEQENEGEFEMSFNNLIRDQIKSEYSEISEFLNEINLGNYLNLFVENGVDDLKKITQIDEKILDQMKIPLGHKLKILRKAGKLKNIQQDSDTESSPEKDKFKEKVVSAMITNPNNIITKKKVEISKKT